MVAKLSDVAALAGVSVTTVSRVINNYGSLSQKTINKVHEAMRELHYQLMPWLVRCKENHRNLLD